MQAPDVAEAGGLGEVGTAGVAGLDGDCLLDDGFPEVVVCLEVRLRALAAGALAPLVLVRLRRRKAGVGAGLAGCLLQQDGKQDARQGKQYADHVIGLFGYLAGSAAVLAASNASRAVLTVAITRPQQS